MALLTSTPALPHGDFIRIGVFGGLIIVSKMLNFSQFHLCCVEKTVYQNASQTNKKIRFYIIKQGSSVTSVVYTISLSFDLNPYSVINLSFFIIL